MSIDMSDGRPVVARAVIANQSRCLPGFSTRPKVLRHKLNADLLLFLTALETLVTNTSISTDVLTQNPLFALSTKIVALYSDAIRQNMENLSASSAKIIQEQTIKAWTDAAQSCSTALAENAMSSQQEAIERITEANRKAFKMLGWGLVPFDMRSMTNFVNPALSHHADAKPRAKRSK